MTLAVNFFIKTAAAFVYNVGVESAFSESQIDTRIVADTQEELIKHLCGFLDCNDYTINPTEEDASQIEFSKLETGESMTPSVQEVEAWERGEIKLWLVEYSVYVINESPAVLSPVKGH